MSGRRLREILWGPASFALVAMMLFGCLFMFLGVPLGWLWIGSQVQASASLGTALAVTMVGVIATIIAVVLLLAWLNRTHAALREARNLPTARHSALEVMLVVSTAVTAVLFAIWFFGFAGTSPIPLRIGY